MEKIENKIKNFFNKKKTEAKFKSAGPGRKLADTAPQQLSASSSKKPQDVYVPVKRGDLSKEAKMARDAALNRVTKSGVDKPLNFSLKAIKEQARKELEDEKKNASSVESSMRNLSVDEEKKDYAVDGVFFGCPMISEEILPKKEWKGKIKEFLYEQIVADPGLTACLIIKNCNTLDRAEDCIETIKKYLHNIISNPSEDKFHKIRMSNRIFSDKVSNVEGSREFMQAAGFREQAMDDGEKYLVWYGSDFPVEMLIQLHEALDLCEVIQLELDRNVKVLLPSQIQNVSLPPDFFRITMEELKREQQARTSAMEESLILKTKAMREKEQERYANKFKYSLIRIRFPDGLYLQATFGVHEKLSNVFEFVAASLHHESAEFSLVSPDGGKFSNEDSEKSLHNLRLVPNVILKFAYEGASSGIHEYLKEELLMLVQQM